MVRTLPPIDDDIFEALQAKAEPLIDDINAVLRRLLGMSESSAAAPSESKGRGAVKARAEKKSRTSGKRGRRRKSGTRAPRGATLPNSEYELPMLMALTDLGGSATARDVVNRMERILEGKLQPIDREKITTGAIRWKNRTQFVRSKLIAENAMKKDSPRGMWEITDEGRARLGREGAPTA